MVKFPIPQAYENYIKDSGQEEVLPKLNMTSEELFFIGYAQVSMELLSSQKMSAPRLPFPSICSWRLGSDFDLIWERKQ